MQKKKHRRVNFRINHCSSEDPEYPVTELLLQSPDAKGWQSKRFSAYPQIIIIELVEPTLLRQISFLSHQSKIASKIQIETKLEENKDWKKLGYVSLTSNQNTNFQARQLRSANLNGIPSLLIKLTFRTNHVNSQNVFNQVGLISLSVYGDKMVQSNFNVPPSMIQAQGQKTVGTTLEFDKQTMNKLKELQIRKKQAVDNEEFDLAKNIKQEIERIKNIGQTLILLEQKKQQSIKREDYETAKIINEQMKKMRDENHWGPQGTNKPSGNPAQFYKKQKTQNSYEEPEEQESVSPISNQQQRPKPMQQKAPFVTKKQPEMKNQPPQQRAPLKSMDPQDRPLSNGGQKPPQKFDMDDRPLDIKGNKGPSEYQNENQEKEEGGEVESLNKEIHAECQPFFDVFDEEIFKCLYSKDHKNRETGVKMLRDKLGQKIQDREGFIEAMLYAIKCVIDDRIASVLIAVLELFDVFMRKLKPGANSNNLQYAEYIMEKICDYLGHTNQKIVNISETIYSNLPVYQLTSKDVCYKCLTMTYKREKPPKILAGRLKMINKIVSEYQLARNYQDTVNYVIKYVDDKNNEVRTAAINAIVSISNEIGYRALQPFLKNVRPQIIKTIEEQMEGAEGDDRNYEEKPIKPKGQNQPSKGSSRNKNQIQTVENQFIEVPKNNKPQQDDKICPFCKKFDQRFVEEDYLDMHFFHSCPALTICLECKQTIQISTLTSHLVGECENSKYYKKCPRCKEAVHQKIYKTHVEKKECLSAKPLATANRCPLCHLDINPGVNGWKEHLVDEGCENNPRK